MSGGISSLPPLTIQDEGVTQGQALVLDFTGAGVTATSVDETTTVTIPGGGGPGGGSMDDALAVTVCLA